MLLRPSLRFNLPAIVLLTITGTANFAQSTLPASIQPASPSITRSLNLIAGLIAAITQFLKINGLMENHRAVALGHGSHSRNIRLQLALPREERKKKRNVKRPTAVYLSIHHLYPSISYSTSRKNTPLMLYLPNPKSQMCDKFSS